MTQNTTDPQPPTSPRETKGSDAPQPPPLVPSILNLPPPDLSERSRGRLRYLLFGRPRDLRDRSIFRHIALVPLLAWVGLGADGLSSSAYGPEEAFRALKEHTYLALLLAVVMATTVIVIASAYSRIIEAFPRGGGGYVVASTLLGRNAGVVSGSALLVDYVLTITISISAASDALFSFLPMHWHELHLSFDLVLIIILVILNIRGVRESVAVLLPIFTVFAISHAVAIVGGLIGHVPQMDDTARSVMNGFRQGWSTLGLGGMALLFMHAYSLGGGTYTGIEAVSNGLSILREPRVQNGKRTMALMAGSLAFTAAGLLILYLLWDIRPQEGKTMNALLLQRMTENLPAGSMLAFITILSEGALLVVAAQAGFIGGPGVLANMAMDSYLPRRFAALSERLTTQNGVMFMGAASIVALIYTDGNVHKLVILYSINVFITFSMSMFAMLRRTLRLPVETPRRRRHLALFIVAFLMCATILAVTVVEKFHHGGWVTLVVTGGLVATCLFINRHYHSVSEKLSSLYPTWEPPPGATIGNAGEPDPTQPTAVVLVGGYSGLGIHTLLNVFRAFPRVYKGVVFLSIGALDSDAIKNDNAVEEKTRKVKAELDRYVSLARRMGVPATSRFGIATDVVDEADRICAQIAREFAHTTFFAGKVVFKRESWYHRLLHNETAMAIQKRLVWRGQVMVILPARVP